MPHHEGTPIPQRQGGSGSANSDKGRNGGRLSFGPSRVLVAYRPIRLGDEHALHPDERVGLLQSVEKVRRQSGAARRLARDLLKTFGHFNVTIRRSSNGAPLWPAGIVGSLAHDDTVAVAALARADDFLSIGVDVEPVMPLPGELVELISTPRERQRYAPAVLESRLLFVLKEAVYKATCAIDNEFLEFNDVEVDLASGIGVTRTGYEVNISYTFHPCLVAIAFLPR
jgi:4'-phosphopantetheinyl transferase EntD